MTNKSAMVSVPRELLERIVQADFTYGAHGSPSYGFPMLDELHDALESAPAEDVSAVVDEPVAWAQNTDLSAIGSGALWSGTLWGRANPPILPNRSPLYTHPRRPVVMPEPEAFERMVIEHFGFGPSQLCLLSGRDLKVIFDACIDEFGRLNPEIPK